MLLPELPEALIVRRNAHGFSHSFTALQMDKYGRDCAEVAQMEVARLTAELGDLPQAQAEMLTEIKALRANNRDLLDQRYVLMQVEPMTAVADRYAHRMALELECVLADRPGYYDKAMQVLCEYRSAMNRIHEKHSPTFMGEPVLPREHITDGTPCWCNPEKKYKDPDTGVSVIVHKEMQ